LGPSCKLFFLPCHLSNTFSRTPASRFCVQALNICDMFWVTARPTWPRQAVLLPSTAEPCCLTSTARASQHTMSSHVLSSSTCSLAADMNTVGASYGFILCLMMYHCSAASHSAQASCCTIQVAHYEIAWIANNNTIDSSSSRRGLQGQPSQHQKVPSQDGTVTGQSRDTCCIRQHPCRGR
jgi:hypothetical protein